MTHWLTDWQGWGVEPLAYLKIQILNTYNAQRLTWPIVIRGNSGWSGGTCCQNHGCVNGAHHHGRCTGQSYPLPTLPYISAYGLVCSVHYIVKLRTWFQSSGRNLLHKFLLCFYKLLGKLCVWEPVLWWRWGWNRFVSDPIILLAKSIQTL